MISRKSTDDDNDPDVVKVVSILERQKTNRVLIVVVGVVAGIGIITGGVVLVVGSEPWWVTILKIILPTVVGGAGTAFVLQRIVVKVRVYLAAHSKRMIVLERTVDPDRESSGINPDGTFRHD